MLSDSLLAALYQHSTRVAQDRQIEVLRTPVRAPNANAFMERFIGSIRREYLDHLLILNERHLDRVITGYVTYINVTRPHYGLGQRIPDPLEVVQGGKVEGW